jgi:hypothetical protein
MSDFIPMYWFVRNVTQASAKAAAAAQDSSAAIETLQARLNASEAATATATARADAAALHSSQLSGLHEAHSASAASETASLRSAVATAETRCTEAKAQTETLQVLHPQVDTFLASHLPLFKVHLSSPVLLMLFAPHVLKQLANQILRGVEQAQIASCTSQLSDCRAELHNCQSSASDSQVSFTALYCLLKHVS